VDKPVMILAWDEESEEEESDAFLIEDSEGKSSGFLPMLRQF
jgi:hypothetical protein